MGAAKKSNTNRIRTLQTTSFRRLSNAPPYISNYTLHNDFHMKTIVEKARTSDKRFHNRLQTHPNHFIKDLSILILPGSPNRRLKKKTGAMTSYKNLMSNVSWSKKKKI